MALLKSPPRIKQVRPSGACVSFHVHPARCHATGGQRRRCRDRVIIYGSVPLAVLVEASSDDRPIVPRTGSRPRIPFPAAPQGRQSAEAGSQADTPTASSEQARPWGRASGAAAPGPPRRQGPLHVYGVGVAVRPLYVYHVGAVCFFFGNM
jgi:hypothetical protein